MSSEGEVAHAQISSLRLQASQMLASIATTSVTKPSVGGDVLVNFGIQELVPWGWKGTGRKIVSGLERSGRIAAKAKLQQQVDSLVVQARSLAREYSVNDRTLRDGPNSAGIVRRLGTSLDRGSPETRLRSLVGALDTINALNLVSNVEVQRILDRRRFAKTRISTAKIAPELRATIESVGTPQDPPYYEARLSPFKITVAVSEPIDGALARLREGGPDAYRQGAGSLRVAFEALLMELTGLSDWKSGVWQLVSSDEERGIAVRLHRLLSRSAHPGHLTSKEDLQLELELFVTIATRLLQFKGLAQS